MNGLDLFLREAIDIEKTHQLVFYILLKHSDFGIHLFFMKSPNEPKWESEKRLFDLSWDNAQESIFLEFKVWCELTDNQIERQTDYLRYTMQKGYYILLGTAWFEWKNEEIRTKSEGFSQKVGYHEIIAALDKVISNPNNYTESLELASSYKIALLDHLNRFMNRINIQSEEKNAIYYYSLLYNLQEELKNISTSIYRVSHPGGLVYILNDRNKERIELDGEYIDIYSEIVNETLCIKLNTSIESTASKRLIREQTRNIVHKIFEGKEFGQRYISSGYYFYPSPM